MNMMSNVEINVSHLVIGRVADKLSLNYIESQGDQRVANGNWFIPWVWDQKQRPSRVCQVTQIDGVGKICLATEITDRWPEVWNSAVLAIASWVCSDIEAKLAK